MPQEMRNTIDRLGIDVVKVIHKCGNDEMTDNDLMTIVSNSIQLICIVANTLDRIADAVEAQKPKSAIHNPFDGMPSAMS